MAGQTVTKPWGYMKFDGGVDEYHDAIDIPNARLKSCINLHFDKGEGSYRPGRKKWGPEFAAPFDGVHEYIDATGTSRILVASGGKVYAVDSTSKTELDTVTQEELHFHTHRGRCWYNGAITQRKLTGATASRVGVEPPANAPTLGSTGTGVTGDYGFVYTFGIEEDGITVWESDPSPISSVTVSNKTITVLCDASADSRVNARYIYRTSTGGAQYFYDGAISDNVAGTAYNSNRSDVTLGALVEFTHGVPEHGKISEGCNERMFFLSDDKLMWSEQAETEAYQEYQAHDAETGINFNFKPLIGAGKGSGLRRIYSTATTREDLYIFQQSSVSVLAGGNVGLPISMVNKHKGCIQHDSIVEYNGKLVFRAQDNTVCVAAGGRVIDISTRNIPASLATSLLTAKTRCSLIQKHYYTMCISDNPGKLYNNSVWVCDLRTIREVEDGFADAVWEKWDMTAEYILETYAGQLICFDQNKNTIFELKFDQPYDLDENGNRVDFNAELEVRDFFAGLNTRINPKYVTVRCRTVGGMTIQPFYGNNYRGSAVNVLTTSQGAVAIAGLAIAGRSRVTQISDKVDGPVDCKVVGSWCSFKFTKVSGDQFFKLRGWDFTYNAFQRV
jgi:hypothetical protein